METEAIEQTARQPEAQESESTMTLAELKQLILAEGTADLDLFARNCWAG